jgi:hypothetical protein
MTDPFWMLGLLHILGRDYYVWDRAGAIDFLKPGRGTVRTSFRIDDALLDELRAEAAGGERCCAGSATTSTKAARWSHRSASRCTCG